MKLTITTFFIIIFVAIIAYFKPKETPVIIEKKENKSVSEININHNEKYAPTISDPIKKEPITTQKIINNKCIQNNYETIPTEDGCLFILDGIEKTVLCYEENLYITDDRVKDSIIKTTPTFRGGVRLNGVNILCNKKY
ncbi:hypothetical protein ACUM6W_14255 [Acinetobacter tandoii]|jgi:hypothetical protein|uniref:hypothetical protein n=1 Tax=Acinetobacter tandoii TaxID=202954 RepID=UPI0040461BAF